MGKRLPVTPDRGQEPAEAEGAGGDAWASKLAGHQQRLRLDGLVKLVERKIAGFARDGIDNAIELVRRLAAIDMDAAPAHAHQRGRRQRAKPLLAQLSDPARLEAQKLGCADQIGKIGRPLGQRQLPAQFRWIGRDAVIGTNAAKGREAGIGWCLRAKGTSGHVHDGTFTRKNACGLRILGRRPPQNMFRLIGSGTGTIAGCSSPHS